MNLNQVTVPSTDVARSIAFYRALGLVLIVDARPGYARFECPAGDATFSVELVADPLPGASATVYFECDNVDGRVAELMRAGVAFDTEPKDQSWLWREARLRDPDGNRICLFHAGPNRRFPPWRVTASAVETG